jgi:3-oxoacyl-[acyl-carrier protein] reductase
VAATVERHGAIHILVNNAGITRDKLLIQMKEDDWDAVIDTNLKGAWTAIQAVTKPMMKQRYGRIINIASVVGQMGNPGQANYVAAKAGLIGLTKSVARELASRNVTANAVTPGYIETAMTAGLAEDVKVEFTKQIPLGRMGTGADIAAAVGFLASDEAGYITGQVLSVNGGMLMA